MIAATLHLSRRVTALAGNGLTTFTLGLMLASILVRAPAMAASDSQAWVFFSGAIAICAMVLPGISGSFILLLLGMYAPTLQAG